MNIRFPEAQNIVSTLFEIGIARFVSFHIRCLDSVQIATIDRGIGMPEISIPLNDNRARRNEHIHNKLSADHLLFQVVNSKAIQYCSACKLESIRVRFMWELENSNYAFLLCCSISASIRAMIPMTSPHNPSSNIERFAASRTAPYFSASSFFKRALASLLFGLWCRLPRIGAIQRTKTNSTSRCMAIFKRYPALFAGEYIAGIAPFCIVCTWSKVLSAFLAPFCFSNILYSHITIIPWRIGVVKCKSN